MTIKIEKLLTYNASSYLDSNWRNSMDYEKKKYLSTLYMLAKEARIDSSDYESIQRAGIYLKKNGYEKIADKILCLAYKENKPEDDNYIEMYKEVSDCIYNHSRELYDFYLEWLLNNEQQFYEKIGFIDKL